MGTRVSARVMERLVADAERVGAAADLVQAALEGDMALARALAGETVVAAPEVADRTPLPALWLAGIEVAGFRGVGPAVRLELSSAPGLTLVVGRNGTGKSSVAEGAEVLFTGDSRRFAGRTAEWREGWRNLATPVPRVAAELATEGRGRVEVARTWPDGAALTAGELTVPAMLAGLPDAVKSFRPFLGTTEMGRMFDEGPSVLYDALRAILGLEELVEAQRRLAETRKAAKRVVDEAKDAGKALSARLAAVDDPRAAEAVQALSGRKWDRATLERLATAVADDVPAGLRAAAEIPSAPAPIVAAVQDAWARADALAGTGAEVDRRAAEVLAAALRWHEAHGDGRCPVCEGGTLDATWRARAAILRTERDALARDATTAQAGLAEAEAAARRWLRSLDAPPDVGPTPDAVSRALLGLELGGGELLEHLATVAAEAWEARRAVAAAAEAAIALRADRFAPWARQLAGLVSRLDDATQSAERARRVEVAERWLKEVEDELREEAFRPIASEAQAIWGLLRQESSVALSALRLAGTGTKRRVEIGVAVDGEGSAALSVMSQGEINALALALFLPRATRPESPFRFVIVDDPVQSMDPSKVDGLARLLGEVAKTRQVVVFTHDPRLPDAIERLRVAATVVEVTRRAGSVVELRQVSDPVRQHLLDADRVARDRGIGSPLAERVVPTFCRAAVEALAIARVRARRLGRGERSEDVEQELADARALVPLLALLLFDDRARHADVMPRLHNAQGARAADTVRRIKEAAHAGDRDPVGLVEETRALCRKLEGIA